MQSASSIWSNLLSNATVNFIEILKLKFIYFKVQNFHKISIKFVSIRFNDLKIKQATFADILVQFV